MPREITKEPQVGILICRGGSTYMAEGCIIIQGSARCLYLHQSEDTENSSCLLALFHATGPAVVA